MMSSKVILLVKAYCWLKCFRQEVRPKEEF
jgi:hypothetical protein